MRLVLSLLGNIHTEYEAVLRPAAMHWQQSSTSHNSRASVEAEQSSVVGVEGEGERVEEERARAETGSQ